MRRSAVYWLVQIAGWGGVAAADFFFRLLVAEASLGSLVASLAVCSTGLAASHGVRRWIHSHDWLSLSLWSLVPRIALASFGVGSCLALVGVLVADSFRGFDTRATPHAYLWLTLVGTGIGLAWIALYLAFQGRERSQLETRRRLELDLAARLGELAALQGQLDPHFLYNCLNSIRALITEDADRARTAVTLLASHLRGASEFASRAIVSFEEELRCVHHYLDLESIRYEDRLHTDFDIAGEVTGFSVPARSLQQLVENGIKHGIARHREGGALRIRAWVADSERWSLEVRSPGPWKRDDEHGGLGVPNLRQRLHILYGDAARLLFTQDGGEVVAELSLPISGPNIRTGSEQWAGADGETPGAHPAETEMSTSVAA
ncbi:MAG: histidine kinase [Thermoanaerobaculia bacterium]|nr:histidine kinase [Thermoanaerobaculia bacterium]